MKMTKMISPDDKVTIDCHPSNVQARISAGWKEANKNKPETKNEVVKDDKKKTDK